MESSYEMFKAINEMVLLGTEFIVFSVKVNTRRKV